MLDVAIRGGQIIDGTGVARYTGDVGISGDTISEVGQVGAARSRSAPRTGSSPRVS